MYWFRNDSGVHNSGRSQGISFCLRDIKSTFEVKRRYTYFMKKVAANLLIWGSVAAVVVAAAVKVEQTNEVLEQVAEDSDFYFLSWQKASTESRIAADERGIMEYVADSTAEYLGYTPEEMLGRSIEMIIPDEMKAQHAVNYQRKIDAAKTREPGWNTATVTYCDSIHKDGHRIRSEIRARVRVYAKRIVCIVTLTPVELIEFR